MEKKSLNNSDGPDKQLACQPYTRHSPDAITVTEYLTEHTEFSATVMTDDVLCKACYDKHLTILNFNSISHSDSEEAWST